MKGYQKGAAHLILLIVIVVVVIGSGVYYLQNKNTQDDQVGGSNTQATTTQVGDWKKYTNTKYGFEISYPSIWMIDVQNEVFYLDRVDNKQVRGRLLNISISTDALENAIKKLEPTAPITREKYSSDHVQGVKITAGGEDGGINQYILISHNNKTYILGGELGMYEDIISTFKFITPTAQTPSLKTFSDKTYGFEFKYPSNLYVQKSGYGSGEGWWFLTQQAAKPTFGNENVCGISKDYVNVQALGDYRKVYVYSGYTSVDALVRGFEKDFDTGTKVSDTVVNGTRVVKFDLRGSDHYYLINGNNLFTFSYQKCAGGSLPIADIVLTFKFTGSTN